VSCYSQFDHFKPCLDRIAFPFSIEQVKNIKSYYGINEHVLYELSLTDYYFTQNHIEY
jgi:hypothetical protein